MFSSVESVFIMADHPRFSSPHCSTSEVAIQKWKTLFFSEIIKVAWVKFHTHWIKNGRVVPIKVRGCKIAKCIVVAMDT